MTAHTPLPLRLLHGYSRIAPTERGGYRLVRLARRLIPHNQWNSTFQTPHGLSLQLDLATYPDCCMAAGLYELDTLRLMRRLLHPGNWFVDGGANLGYFTLLAAQWVGENGRIDAFEPDPLNRARLETHLAGNVTNCRPHVHPAALGDKSGTLELFHPSGQGVNHGMASAYASLFAQADRYTVPVVRLDEELDGVPNLIKLDVEGGEYAALEGMRKLLSSPKPPRLIVEHNPASAKASGHAPGDIHRLLHSMRPDVRVYWIGRKPHPIASAQELDTFTRQVNLLIEFL